MENIRILLKKNRLVEAQEGSFIENCCFLKVKKTLESIFI